MDMPLLLPAVSTRMNTDSEEFGQAPPGPGAEAATAIAETAPGGTRSALRNFRARANALLVGYTTPATAPRGDHPPTGLLAAGVDSNAMEDYFTGDGMEVEVEGTDLAAVMEDQR